MMLKRWLIFTAILLFLFLGCQKSKEQKMGEKELVRIDDSTISLEEFRRFTEDQSLEGKMRLLSEKGLRDFLENYVITRELLYQEARKKGFEKNPDMRTKLENFKRMMLIDALMEEILKGKTEISESEIQQYYKENPDRFTEPLEIKIRHIFVTSEPALKEVLMKLSQKEDFSKLASVYNLDKSREDGGNLGWIKRGQLAPSFSQFEDAAFSLKNKGETSEVVQTGLGYHIIQLDEKRGSVLRPYDKVKESLRFFLQTKKRQDTYLQYVKELKSKAKIVVNEKLWAEEEKKGLKPIEEKSKEEKATHEPLKKEKN
ncbi:MAG TPA: peptidyl-prolyl cis-trans isomerase [Thermodesulfobacteriota bacterium]|nr:peptidyl-prolyl cis-trans isomerase [Thermodesulfobacteriota bacterium]